MRALRYPALQLIALTCSIVSTLIVFIPYLKESKYTFQGYDYPEKWYIPKLKNVAMAVEETLHYPIEGPIALHDWASNKPAGAGFVRLGPNRRMFSISMAHQLHCLRIIRAALVNETPTAFQHSHHCLNYIRQMTLCNPDLTLERFDPLDRDFEVDRVGAMHVCKDWTAVYTAFSENLADFKQYVNEL